MTRQFNYTKNTKYTNHLIQSLCQNMMCEHSTLFETSWASICYLKWEKRKYYKQIANKKFKRESEYLPLESFNAEALRE